MMAYAAGHSARLTAVVFVGFLSLTPACRAADCPVIDALDLFAASGVPPSSATCITYVTDTAAVGASCHWSHPYRDGLAQSQAADLWRQLTACRDGHPLNEDTQVNHPDSYDLREWAHGQDVYGVSIKDKAALNRTLVFIRIEPDRTRPEG